MIDLLQNICNKVFGTVAGAASGILAAFFEANSFWGKKAGWEGGEFLSMSFHLQKTKIKI